MNSLYYDRQAQRNQGSTWKVAFIDYSYLLDLFLIFLKNEKKNSDFVDVYDSSFCMKYSRSESQLYNIYLLLWARM